jgi:hypothetical protein
MNKKDHEINRAPKETEKYLGSQQIKETVSRVINEPMEKRYRDHLNSFQYYS